MQADKPTTLPPSQNNAPVVIDEYKTDLKDAEVDKSTIKVISAKNSVWNLCISNPYLYKYENKLPEKPSKGKERKFKEILKKCMLFTKSDSYQKIKAFFVEYKMEPIYITTKDCIEVENKKHLALQIDLINKNTIQDAIDGKIKAFKISSANIRSYCTQCIYALQFAKLTHGNINPQHILVNSRDNISSNIIFISLAYNNEICDTTKVDQFTKINPANKYFPALLKLNSANPVAIDTYCLAKIYFHLLYNNNFKKKKIEELTLKEEEFKELSINLLTANERKLLIVLKDILTIKDVKARTFSIAHNTIEYLLILFALPLLEESEVIEYLEATSDELALLLKKFNPDIDQHSLAFKNYIEESSTIAIGDKDKIKGELEMEKLFKSEFIISREVPKIYKAVLEVFYYKEDIDSFFINNNKGVCFDTLIMKEDVNMSSENRVDRDRILILQVLYAIYHSDIELNNITPSHIFKFHADIKILLIKLYDFSKNSKKKRQSITYKEITNIFVIFYKAVSNKMINTRLDITKEMVNEIIDHGKSILHKVFFKIFKYALFVLQDDNNLANNIKVIIFWLLSLPLVESEGDMLKNNCPNDFEFQFLSEQKRFLFQVDFDDLPYKRELLIAEINASKLIKHSDYIVKHDITIEEVKSMQKEQIEKALRGEIDYPITLNDFVANNKQLKFYEQRKILAQILLAYYKNEICLNRIEPADIYILKGYKIKIVNIRNIERAQPNSILNFSKVAENMKNLYEQYREKEVFKLYEEYLKKLTQETTFASLRRFIFILFNIYQSSMNDLENMLIPIDDSLFNTISLDNIELIKINCKSALKIIKTRKEVSALFGQECISRSLQLTENEYKQIFQLEYYTYDDYLIGAHQSYPKNPLLIKEDISIDNLRSIIGQLLYFSCLNNKFYFLNEDHVFYNKETKRVVINEIIKYYDFKETKSTEGKNGIQHGIKRNNESNKNKSIEKYTNKFIEYINSLFHHIIPPTKFNKNIMQRSKIKLIKILSKLSQCSTINLHVLAQIWHLVVNMPSLSIKDIELFCLNPKIDSLDKFNKQDTYPFFSDFQYTPNSCSLIYNKQEGVLSTLKIEKEDQLLPVYNLSINGVAVLANQSYAEKSNNFFSIRSQSASEAEDNRNINIKIGETAFFTLPQSINYSLRPSAQPDYIVVIKGYMTLKAENEMTISLKLENGNKLVELIVENENDKAYLKICRKEGKKDEVKNDFFEYTKKIENKDILIIAYKYKNSKEEEKIAQIKNTEEIKLSILLKKKANYVYNLFADDKEIFTLNLRTPYAFKASSVGGNHKDATKLFFTNKELKLAEGSIMEVIECYPDTLKCYLLADRKNIWNHIEGSIVIKMDEHILQIGYMMFSLVRKATDETATSLSVKYEKNTQFNPSLTIKNGNKIDLIPCKDEIQEKYKLVLYYTSLLREEYNSNKSNCIYGISSTYYGYTTFKDISKDLEALFCFGGFTKSSMFNSQAVPQTEFNKTTHQTNDQPISCTNILQIYLFNCHRYSFNSTPLYFVTSELEFTPRYCCSLVIQIIKKTPHLFVVGGKQNGEYVNYIEYTTFQITRYQKREKGEVNIRDITSAAFIEKDNQENLFKQTTMSFDCNIRKIKIEENIAISNAMAFPIGEREFLIFGNDFANLESSKECNAILKACLEFEKSTSEMTCVLKAQKGEVIGVRNFSYPIQVENFIIAKNVNSNIVFAYDKDSEKAYYKIT